ncbi:MAG: hypothetical protein WBR26_25285 [Candidatus Acidiferrum sp.]
MNKAAVGVILLVGMACGVSAQEPSAVQEPTISGTSMTLSSAPQVSLLSPSNSSDSSQPNATPEANAAASPTPAVPADPKYVFFGDRDDYRWQLGVGVEYLRFQSNAFNANLVGLNTTVSYYTNSWFALEGNVVTGFGGDIYPDSRAKIFGGAGGIKIGGRRARWEPWAHALVGGGHLQPQTAFGGKGSLMAQAGIGVDFRLHARLSLRGEGDWVYTTYFNQTQNNLQVVGGIVFHF